MEDDLPECKSGHFVCEVWVPEWEKWIYVDPDQMQRFTGTIDPEGSGDAALVAARYTELAD